MIECYDKNIYYTKKKWKNSKKFFAFFISFLFVTILICYYKYVVSNNIINICADSTYSIATESVNTAVMNSLSDQIKYSNLVVIEKNSSGDIVLMSTDSLKVNTINREIALKTQDLLCKKLEKGINIPIMSFFGFDFLSGYGAPVNFKALSVSDVICEFSSKFESVGLNQTRHSIYLNVICQVDIEIPLNKKTEICKTSVLVSETVLVGKVPEVYLNGNLFS